MSAVTVVDTATVAAVRTIPLAVALIGVTVSPDARRVYVVDDGTAERPGATISVIDTQTDAVVTAIRVDTKPSVVVASTDGRIDPP